MSEWIDIGSVADFPLEQAKVVPLEDTSAVVVRTSEGFFALENRCSHAEVALAGGTIADGTITCPRHGARFSLRTGEPLTPPAYEAVTVFPVRVENGRVLLRDSRWD